MAAVPRITKEQIETFLGFSIVSFTQKSTIETGMYIQYDVTVVPVKETASIVMNSNNYIIQVNKDGGEESL